MLLDYIKILKENLIVKKISELFNSYWYLSFMAVISLVSEIFGLELMTYYIVMSVVILGTLMAKDGTYLIAPLMYMYVTFSRINNKAQSGGETLFDNPSFYHQFMIIVGVLSVMLVIRFLYSILIQKNYKKPKLAWGLLALTVTYVLGGLFTEYYSLQTVLFGLLEAGAIVVPYFLVLYSIDFKEMKNDYLAWALTIFGFMMVITLIEVHIYAFSVDVPGVPIKSFFLTGWGIHNNIGGALIIAMAGPIYFVFSKRKMTWLFVAFEALFCLGAIFSQSRNAIVVGLLAFIASMFLQAFFAEEDNKVPNAIAYLCSVIGYGIIAFVLKDLTIAVFEGVMKSLERGSANAVSSDRLRIWEDAIKEQFIPHPVLGVGFYEANLVRVGTRTILPARYHNTIIQLLASTGVVGLIAYLFHRIQTIFLFKKMNPMSWMGLAFILILIGSSLLDCHLYNIGPAIQYGVVLAILEGFLHQDNQEVITELNEERI